jgi:Rad3-related DNA helicase
MSLSWQPFFPFPAWRPVQAEGLDYLIEKFAEADDLMLEGPTGTGKSGQALTLARWAAARGLSTYITTKTISLENQYMRDFAGMGLKQLHSKSRYHCPDCDNCEAGMRAIKTSAGTRCRCRLGDNCSYRIAKAKFQTAAFGIANDKFICTSARYAPDFAQRDLVIFDEGHGLADTIAELYSFDIAQREIDYFPGEGGEISWLKNHYTHKLAVQIRELEEMLAQTDENDPEIEELCKKLEQAEGKRNNLQHILSSSSEYWVFDQQPDQLRISPLWAADFAANLLPRIGSKRIYLSATLPGFKQQARYLGIDPQKARYLALPCPFPVEHRLIRFCPMVSWPKKGQDPESAYAEACCALEKILARHPTERGLVHVSSYPQAREIYRLSQNKRLIIHENAGEKEARFQEMFDRPGTVLLSPSSHEGVDLYDDRCRFQVILKLPFAGIKDKRVARRMQVDPDWYMLNTAQKFVQACGRAVRSENDFAVTYVVDRAFGWFRDRAQKTGLFPEYLCEALRNGWV